MYICLHDIGALPRRPIAKCRQSQTSAQNSSIRPLIEEYSLACAKLHRRFTNFFHLFRCNYALAIIFVFFSLSAVCGFVLFFLNFSPLRNSARCTISIPFCIFINFIMHVIILSLDSPSFPIVFNVFFEKFDSEEFQSLVWLILLLLCLEHVVHVRREITRFRYTNRTELYKFTVLVSLPFLLKRSAAQNDFFYWWAEKTTIRCLISSNETVTKTEMKKAKMKNNDRPIDFLICEKIKTSEK